MAFGFAPPAHHQSPKNAYFVMAYLADGGVGAVEVMDSDGL